MDFDRFNHFAQLQLKSTRSLIKDIIFPSFVCSELENDLRNLQGVVRTSSGEALNCRCVCAVGEKLSLKLTACPPGAQNTPVEKKMMVLVGVVVVVDVGRGGQRLP